MNKKILLISLLILIGLAAGWLALHKISFSYSISARGKVYPQQEWTLLITSDGNIIHKLENHVTQTTGQYAITEFQRGDAGTFSLAKDFEPAASIEAGDTIGFIHSYADRKKLTELRGELEVQRQLLLLYASGDRPQEVEVAYNRMMLAQQDMEVVERVHQRNVSLFQQGHIAEEAYELSAGEYTLKQQMLHIARAQYYAATSGAKEEQLEFVRANIRALQQNVDFLEEVLSTYTITSPISGSIIRRYGSRNGHEALLKVADKSSFIIRVPVEIYQLPHIETGQEIEIFSPLHTSPIKARVFDIDNSVQLLNQRQQVFINVITENKLPPHEELIPGMLVEVNFRSENLSPVELISRFLKEVYNN